MKAIPPIEPVFDRRYQAIAFIVFCVMTMFAPIAVGVVPLEKRYEAIPWNLGNYTFIREQIFGNDKPIDILFLGPSAVWTGVDPVLVQDALRRHLNRDATVLNFGIDFYGQEAAYFLLRDTLERRSVRMVVLGVPSPNTSAPHLVTLRLADSRLDGALRPVFPWQSRLTFYSASVLGAPRVLLSALRENRGLTAFAWGKHHFSRTGQGQHFDTRADADSDSGSILANEAGPVTDESILARGHPRLETTAPAPHQERLLRAIEALCHRRGTGLILLRVPLQGDDGWRVALPQSDLLDGRLKLIAPAPHFMALPPEQRAPYFRNAGHLNYRGAVVFTSAALPALLQAFEEHAD